MHALPSVGIGSGKMTHSPDKVTSGKMEEVQGDGNYIGAWLTTRLLNF